VEEQRDGEVVSGDNVKVMWLTNSGGELECCKAATVIETGDWIWK
jgi:hypothetical protein